MSHCFLRLLTSLIHYCWPSSIIDEQVQYHMVPEPTLPMFFLSTTNITAATTLPETFTTLDGSSLSAMTYKTESRDNISRRPRKARMVREKTRAREDWNDAEQWFNRRVIRHMKGGNECHDNDLKLLKQTLTFIMLLSVDRFHFTSAHQVYTLSKQSIHNDSN